MFQTGLVCIQKISLTLNMIIEKKANLFSMNI